MTLHTVLPRPLPWRPLTLMALLALLGLGLAVYIRFGLVEVTTIGLACDAGADSLQCSVRQGAIWLFGRDILGWTALAAGALTLLRPRWWALGLTLFVGSLGLFLYNTELAAYGLTLAALTLARLKPPAPAVATRPVA